MVDAGLGVAVLPESAFTPDLERRIRLVPIVDPVLRRDIAVLTRAGRSLSPAAQRLIEAMRQEARAARPSGSRRIVHA